MAETFPRPFAGIRMASSPVTSGEALAIFKFFLDEQDNGHYHNFAVEIDHPGGVRFFMSDLGIECLNRAMTPVGDS